MSFDLHPRLKSDCIILGDLPLCQVLLLPDARYPWFILVPRKAGISEIYQMSAADQDILIRESSAFGSRIMSAYKGDKLNIGALGNMVPQLHIHHIVRKVSDPAWPGAVWGHGQALPYSEDALISVKQTVIDLGMPGFMPR